ncbi:MAG TPA: hypothetical protein VF784_11435 [Anaerolineales bacterium]
MQRYLLPRLRDFVFIVLLAGALLSGTRMLNTDGDLGRHLTLGNYILTSRRIPTQDILSFTKTGQARPPYEWLAQVLLALAYRVLNLDGVVLLTSFAIAATFTFVYLDAVRRSHWPILGMFITLWAAAASSLHWVSRPHVFSFLFFAVWLAMLDRVGRGEEQPVWQFPALILLWANTHGGFVFGFLAYAAYLVGWLIAYARGSNPIGLGQKLLLIGGASFIASVLTPDLWGNWTATLNNRSSYILSHTAETMPLNLDLFNVWPFLGLLALSIVLMLLRWKELAPSHVLLLGGLAIMSFAIARNVPLFVIAAAPLCTNWLASALSRVSLWARLEDGFARIDQRLHGFFWSVLALVGVFGFLFFHIHLTQAPMFHLSPRQFPVDAATWLERNPQQGYMFNEINWGGYLLYRLWPEQKVFIDSQTDFYGEVFVERYVAILDGATGWDAQLKQAGVNWLLISPSEPLADIASHTPGWKRAYQDSIAVVIIRR